MRLETLGTLQLKGARFAQPKPLLMLAYLAFEGPQTRAHLAELFWPQGARRKSLSMAITRLRQAAGEVVTTDGQLVQATLESDITELLKALDKGDWGGANNLYVGAFLTGAANEDWNSELEDWIYATREHLAERVQYGLMNLAELAATKQDFREAVAFAEQAYKLPGVGGSDPVTLERLYTLLCMGNSSLTSIVRQEAGDYGLVLQLSQTQATAKFRTLTERPPPPVRRTSFVGRDVELTELATLLAKADISLLTLFGLAGVGKTRLALQFAHDQHALKAYQDGVHFVSLDSLGDAQLLPFTLLSHLGLTPQGTTEAAEQLVSTISERQMLLVLDNFEHLKGAAILLLQLLKGCPNLKILVTSRERLRLEEEYVFPVEGLPYPSAPSEDGSLADAITLFKERAQQAHPHFDLKRELPEVVSICRLLEGSPLGIELAAGWAGVMPCADIAEEIEKNLEFLISTSNDAPVRHHSLKATFEAAWNYLDPKEQEVLAKLSVFRGGFTRTAAATVTGATLLQLASLVDRSLLRVLPDGRYDRHPLLYRFTQEKLAVRSQEKVDAQMKHVEFYLSLAEEAEPQLHGPDQVQWFERLGNELDNFRAALETLDRIQDTATALQLAAQLGYFWKIRGFYDEGSRHLEALLGLGKKEQWAPTAALALLRAGELAWAKSDPDHARVRFEQSLTAAEALGERSLVAQALMNLGIIADRNQGSPEEARSVYMSALKLAEEAGDKDTRVSLLRLLGSLSVGAGDYLRARNYYEASASLASASGDMHSRAKALVSLASVLTDLGDFGGAHALNKQCLELFRTVGDRHGEGIALLNLGMDAAQQGDLESEIRRYRKSLDVFTKLGDRRMVSHLLNNLAGSILKFGDLGEARTLLEESLLIQRTVGDRSLEAHALYLLGEVFSEQRIYKEARRCYDACLSVCRETNDKWLLMRVLGALAQWQLEQHDCEGAQTTLSEALALAYTSGDQKTLVNVLETQAELWAFVGEEVRAMRTLMGTEKLRQSLGFTRPLKRQSAYGELLGRLRGQLGEKNYAEALLEGQLLDFKDLMT